jgi:pimeloyl-ACP methyl ester carboxylesterase
MTDLWFEVTGSGPPLVLVHAGICDARMWDDLTALLEPEHRVVRYEMRGYGRSGAAATDYSPSGDLVSVLDAAGVDRATLCGVSFGGAVALETAVAHPGRVSALVAVCCAVDWSDVPTSLVTRIEEADAAAEAGDLDLATELELRIWVDGEGRTVPVDDGVRERVRAMNRRALELASQGHGDAVWLDPPVEQRLAQIACPTLVVAGEHDVPFMTDGCRRIAAAIPGARFAMVEGAAHLPPLERPDAFAALVRGPGREGSH